MRRDMERGRPRQGGPNIAQGDSTTPKLLDWRAAEVGPLERCVDCRKPALLRDPDSGHPRHKICAEKAAARRARVTRNRARKGGG